MGIRNTKDAYGVAAVAFHWSSAVLAVGLFASGIWMTGLSYYDGWYNSAPDLHKAAGMSFAGLILARLAWKGLDRTPSPVVGPTDRRVAKAVHMLLYLLLAVLFASGYLIATADGRPVSLFGAFEIPSLFHAKGAEAIAGRVHLLSAWVLAGLTAVHAAAALKHHFVDRDEVLTRMLGIPRRRHGDLT